MKTLKSIFLLAFVSFAFISCGDDDNSDSSSSGTGSFVYDGNTFALNKGSVIDFGQDDYYGTDIYNFDIELTSAGLNVDSNGEVTGNGDAVYFELWTDQGSGLKNGTYTYSETIADFIFTEGTVVVDCNITTSGDADCDFESFVVSGTVTINRNGNNYDMSYNLTLNSGDVVTGNYDGTLRPFNG